eukprot:GGOE01011057.1.p1 GENE.GGOE01011057.1~~GGOE01011057.1.p1  ORF type:complete len:580 (-),score=178.53 GGOE01011057.1:387-2003(-)
MRTVLANSDNTSLAYSTTAQVLNAWYGSQFQYNGVSLGPYYSTICSTNTERDCECNEGVRLVTVLTATRQEEPITFNLSISTCRVTYVDLIVAPGQGLWYIGVVVGAVVGVAVLGLLSCWLVRRGQRDNAAAPKSKGQPFCVLFTDIQASTHLWASAPDIMACALYVHHSLIRKLIAHHKLYEVKTIGDSFMCAARSPSKAVEFALDLQREFFEYDWGTDRIDTAYLLQLHGEKVMWGGSHTGWNGLRVRVGIDYGTGEVYLDPVSKGYDYYGTVVNTAARVETVCHGGQIGVTQAVHDALNGEFPGASMTDLGEQILRGLSEPVHLYQLLPLELTMRTFPPLRLEHAGTVEPMGCPSSEDDSTQVGFSRGKVVPVNHGNAPPEPTSPTASAARTGTTAPTASNWVEFHPMVRTGQLSAEDVTVRYLTVHKALMTLLETQSHRVRESSLFAYCERLHVQCTGCEGSRLEEALHGLVQRVLPAALSAVPAALINRRRSTFLHRGNSLEIDTTLSHSRLSSLELPVLAREIPAELDPQDF